MKKMIKKLWAKEYYLIKILELNSLYDFLKFAILFSLALIIVDSKDYITYIYNNFGVFTIILSFFLILILFLDLKFNELLAFKTVNTLDVFIIKTIFTTSIYLLYLYFTSNFDLNFVKILLVSIILIVSIVMFLIRKNFIEKNYIKNKINSPKNNVYDLLELYNNKIECKKGDLIFISEMDVDYDLINRGNIIKDLYVVLTECKTLSKFVISLKGKWGNGKTTIINNVKRLIRENKEKSNEIIIIDDFNPWIYENQESLFSALFDKILGKLDMKFSSIKTNQMLKSYLKIIFSSNRFSLPFLDVDSSEKEISKIKKIINTYLEINNKQLIIIVDNIERSNKENILFIFKMISTILDFDRTIYLLSYDEEEMSRLFLSENVSYDYLEKIIQLEYSVPIIDPYIIKNIATTCLNNLLKIYGVLEKDISSYAAIVDLISNDTKDIRKLKRTINSIFNINKINNNYLNKIDSLMLEIISIQNKALYESIYSNSVFFISEDYGLFNYDYFMDNAGFNKDAFTYYETLFENEANKFYLDMLSLMFPYISKYKEFKNNRSNSYNNSHLELRHEERGYIVPRDKNEYITSVKEKRVYNAKFFDLYFTYSKNEFIEIDTNIQNFVNDINAQKTRFDFNSRFIELISIYDGKLDKYVLETLEYYIDNINQKAYLNLSKAIYRNINTTSDQVEFMVGIDARNRAVFIISELINRFTDEEINQFIDFIKLDYKGVRIISNIIYWLNPEKQYNRQLSQEKYEMIKSVYEKMIIEMKQKKINIYSNKYYAKHNVYCFIDDSDMLKLISSKINSKNIFTVLKDFILTSSGTGGYGYEISSTIFEKLISYEKVEELLNKIKSENMSESEKFIVSVFRSYNNQSEKRIYLKSPFKID